MPETNLDAPAQTRASLPATSLRIIATVIVLVCLYYASSIIISLVCSVFIAFILDPGVKLIERLRIPRWIGALLMVLASLAVVYLVIYLVYDRAAALVENLPAYAARLRQIIAHFEVTVRNIRLSAGSLIHEASSGPREPPTVRVQSEPVWTQWLLRGLGSAYGFVLSVMFMPFLVFYMLASKDQIWATTLNLFPSERRDQAEVVIRGISELVRQYVIGNLLVALISAAIITPVFAAEGLRFALVLGPVAAVLSLIPYVGVLLALAPPLLIGLVQSDVQGSVPFLVIALTVVVVHFIAINGLTPKLVGKRVRLNALSVTLALMFWSWLWGGIGLVLAVPITAAFKAICDNVASLRPYGAWLGSDDN